VKPAFLITGAARLDAVPFQNTVPHIVQFIEAIR